MSASTAVRDPWQKLDKKNPEFQNKSLSNTIIPPGLNRNFCAGCNDYSFLNSQAVPWGGGVLGK